MIPVSSELAAFLSSFSPESLETENWGDTPLSIHGYLSSTLPDSRWVSSVRCVVLSGDNVLVVRNPASLHILPGGRIEPGETPLDTLSREVLEETGWTVRNPVLLGFIHYHHLAPKPPDYRYPYPDFVQIVYGATADRHQPARRERDDYEIEARWMPVAAAEQLVLSARDRLYLRAAQQTRQT